MITLVVEEPSPEHEDQLKDAGVCLQRWLPCDVLGHTLHFVHVVDCHQAHTFPY